jgi:hypothetical protein
MNFDRYVYLLLTVILLPLASCSKPLEDLALECDWANGEGGMTVMVMGSTNQIIISDLDSVELPIVDVSRSYIKAEKTLRKGDLEESLTATIDRNSGRFRLYASRTKNGEELKREEYTGEKPVICQVAKKLDNKF